MAYLKGRELSDETINKFGLGYSGKFSNNLYQYLKGKNYSMSSYGSQGCLMWMKNVACM